LSRVRYLAPDMSIRTTSRYARSVFPPMPSWRTLLALVAAGGTLTLVLKLAEDRFFDQSGPSASIAGLVVGLALGVGFAVGHWCRKWDRRRARARPEPSRAAGS
jgi:hypothetical protein